MRQISDSQKKASQYTMTLLTTIDVEESDTQKTSKKEGIEEEEEGVAELECPFVVKKRKKQTSTAPRKKQKPDQLAGATPLVITQRDLNEIGDVVRDMVTNLWGHFEEQYQQVLGKVQQDLGELQIQTSMLQVSVGQASGKQASLSQVRGFILDKYMTLDHGAIQLPEGSLHTET